MTITDRTLARAEGHFLPKIDQHEKGSAMGLIRAGAKAIEEKTARLRALRMERDASEPAAAKPAPKAPRKTVRRGRSG